MASEQQAKERAEKIAFWQPHIEAWQLTNLPVTKYCQQQQLNPDLFRYWQYQLAPDSKRQTTTSTQTPAFIELTTALNAEGLETSALPPIEICSNHGFTIKIHNSANHQQLLMLLQALKALA